MVEIEKRNYPDNFQLECLSFLIRNHRKLSILSFPMHFPMQNQLQVFKQLFWKISFIFISWKKIQFNRYFNYNYL